MQEQSNDNGKIDRLKKKLYDREKDPTGHSHGELEKKEYNVERSWKHDAENDVELSDESMRFDQSNDEGSYLNKFLVFSGIFFVLALIFAAITIGLDQNAVSAENVGIGISGPVSARAGEPVNLEITLQNDNEVPLQSAELIVEYPPGTRSTEDNSEILRRQRESVGTIAPNGSQTILTSARLFGEQGESKRIGITLEYRVPDSNAVFTAERVYEIEVTGSPVSVSLEAPDESDSGQDISLVFQLQSNSEETIEDIMVDIKYPFGFEITSTDPAGDYNDTVFRVGSLEPGEERTVTINGRIEGQHNDERVFQYEVGIESAAEEGVIATPFVERNHTVALQRPSFVLDIDYDTRYQTSGGTPATPQGSNIEVEVNWTSNFQTQIVDAEMIASMTGPLIEYDRVRTNGFYTPSDRSILWNSRNGDDLRSILPGDSGSFSFSIPLAPAQDVSDPDVDSDVSIDVRMSGQAIDESSGERPVEATRSANLIVLTDLGLLTRTLYEDGPFSNTGPKRPEGGEESTYTIHWQVTNSINDVENAVVTGILPPNVEFTSNVSEPNETVRYNDVTGEVRWIVSDVSAGAGYLRDTREVYFQVRAIPSQIQSGSTIDLVRNVVLQGEDAATGVTLQDTSTRDMTTSLQDGESPRESD